MKSLIALLTVLIGSQVFAVDDGHGQLCKDAARAAARQEAYNIMKRDGLYEAKTPLEQASFSAKEKVVTLEEGRQGIFTVEVEVGFFSTDPKYSGSMILKVEGQYLGQCNIYSVNKY